jgi:hypothetical protein
MTRFLHWRKMTWALVLWSVAAAALVIAGAGAVPLGITWLLGAAVLGVLWFMTQPLIRQGRGLRRIFVKPGPGNWRVLNLHRAPVSTH